jgi:hypothetical protein
VTTSERKKNDDFDAISVRAKITISINNPIHYYVKMPGNKRLLGTKEKQSEQSDFDSITILFVVKVFQMPNCRLVKGISGQNL